MEVSLFYCLIKLQDHWDVNNVCKILNTEQFYYLNTLGVERNIK